MAKRKGEINFVLIGAKETGKTEYIKHLNKSSLIVTKGKKTRDYINAISKKEDKTQATSISYTELYFNYKDDDTYNIDFQIDDYDGNFVETWGSSEKNKEYKDKLTEYVKESEGIFVFLPYEDQDSKIRFDLMLEENETFINKIQDEYGETHKELPIPLTIVVSKWDRSPSFKEKNKDEKYQNEKAREYIGNNKTLKEIKDKLENYFAKIDIIPLSSTEKYNITLPIKMSLDYTFKRWEKKIEKLEKSKKKKELRVFLGTILHDIQHYKDGKYKELFDELVSKDKWTKLFWTASVIIVLVATALGYSKYKLNKGEERLFYNIQTEFENKNYSATLSNIKIYYTEYNGVDKKHNKDIKNLEEQAKAKYRVEIDRVMANFSEIKSAVKAYGIISEINIKVKEYRVPPATLSSIQKKFLRLNEINGAYKKANEEIDKLSLESISKEKIDDIASNKSKLVGFTEYQILEKTFDAKIQTILNATLESDDENRLELILDIASSIKMVDNKIAALKEKLHKIKVDLQFNEFLEQLKKIDNIEDLTNKISIDWSAEYDDNKKKVEIRNLVEIKYNEWVKKQLKREAPKSINNIDDYSRLDTFVREGINMQQRIKSMPVKISISKSIENKKMYDGKIKLFQRYKEIFENGVPTTSFTLQVQKGNSLDITRFDDKVSIYINGYRVYQPSDSNGFHSNKIVFRHRYKYKARGYSLKIEETDLVYDDYATENFTITDTELIELENKGHLYIELEDGYAIKIYK